jgi:hypothetical protein
MAARKLVEIKKVKALIQRCQGFLLLGPTENWEKFEASVLRGLLFQELPLIDLYLKVL